MTLIVVDDPKEREQEDAFRKRMQELQQLVQQKADKEPHIVMRTTCPTCGHKRYVPIKREGQ